MNKPWLVWRSGLSAGLRTARGRQFDSWSGHMPGLQAGYLWEHARGNRLMYLFLSLTPSLKNKILKKQQRNE